MQFNKAYMHLYVYKTVWMRHWFFWDVTLHHSLLTSRRFDAVWSNL